MEVTTWVKRRQSDIRAVMQMKQNEPREISPGADKVENLEGNSRQPMLNGEGCWRPRRGLSAWHEWKRKH